MMPAARQLEALTPGCPACGSSQCMAAIVSVLPCPIIRGRLLAALARTGITHASAKDICERYTLERLAACMRDCSIAAGVRRPPARETIRALARALDAAGLRCAGSIVVDFAALGIGVSAGNQTLTACPICGRAGYAHDRRLYDCDGATVTKGPATTHRALISPTGIVVLSAC